MFTDGCDEWLGIKFCQPPPDWLTTAISMTTLAVVIFVVVAIVLDLRK